MTIVGESFQSDTQNDLADHQGRKTPAGLKHLARRREGMMSVDNEDRGFYRPPAA